MELQPGQSMPIACDLTALDAQDRSAHAASARLLMRGGAAETQELPDGYAFRYSAGQYDQVARFIASERLCCPFFRFALEVNPAQGPIWLRVTGDAAVKEFLQGALGQRACEG